MNLRIKKLIAEFSKNGIDSFLNVNKTNITYLTKFESYESWLLVTKRGSFYITDNRYFGQAKKMLKGIKVICFQDSLSHTLFSLAQANKIKSIGFDENHSSLFQYKKLKNKCPKGIKLVTVNNLVENLRTIKCQDEINKIKEALKIHKKGHQFLKMIIRPGIKESEVALQLEGFLRTKKATFSFSPIIASGPNSSYPHAQVSRREIKKNDLVLVDIGIDYKGYKSDLTRIFFLGRIPESINNIYSIIKETQAVAINKIKPGIACADVDNEARNYLAKKGLDKYFTHSLGHGVGLEIHENPRLSKKSFDKLAEGMVVTVEPGVYFNGKFGIRIEDMVLITTNGCEVLSDNIN